MSGQPKAIFQGLPHVTPLPKCPLRAKVSSRMKEVYLPQLVRRNTFFQMGSLLPPPLPTARLRSSIVAPLGIGWILELNDFIGEFASANVRCAVATPNTGSWSLAETVLHEIGASLLPVVNASRTASFGEGRLQTATPTISPFWKSFS